jgi:LPS-assembly protein
MKQLYKTTSKYFSAALFVTLLLQFQTWKAGFSAGNTPSFYNALTVIGDTSKLPIATSDSLKPSIRYAIDTTTLPSTDSLAGRSKVDTFNLKMSKDSLEAPLKYEALDSAVILVGDKKVLLYGKTKTEYKDITLKAPQVEVDQQTQIVTAVNAKDSTGEVTETAHFKSGETEFTSDTIKYNFKSQIGLTKNTFIQQEEILVNGEVVKKVNDNTTFIKRARFSTCLLDEPHFAFVTPKMKMINQKLAVSGPAHPEFEGVPVPIYVPFGFYPLKRGRSSGLLRPEFMTDEVRGLGLQGLGFYKTLGDHWDAQVTGDIFSYGEWAVGLRTNYTKRYKYRGGFSLSYRNSKLNFKNDPDFQKNKVIGVNWMHSMDSKARPGVTFSASVNASSTKMNRLIPGNPYVNYNNTQGSTISFAKSWKDKPFNLSINASHSQNNNLHLITINTPDIAFNVNTIYPFQRKNPTGSSKWYEKLGVGYTGSFRNTVSFYDTVQYGKNGNKSFLQHIKDTAFWSAEHSVPITLSLPPILGGNVLVAPGISYGQSWSQRKIEYRWNAAANKVDTIVSKGIFIDQRSSASLSFNTAIYGTKFFKPTGQLLALRHTIRPQAGFSYTPDLNKRMIKSVQINATGKTIYYNQLNGAELYNNTKRESAAMNFGVDNSLEMKWRSKKDTTNGGKKNIKLIDGFGFNGSYDFMRETNKLSYISTYMRTTLFEKISINASASLNPYQSDLAGNDIDKYAWQGGGFKLGRINSANITISTNFQSKPKDPQKDANKKKAQQEMMRDPALMGDQQRLMDYMQQNPAEFVDFNIDWNLGLSYSLLLTSIRKPDFSGFTSQITQGITFNGGFNLTPKWKITGNGSYDISTSKIQYLALSINREMHCWQLSINVVPVGFTRSFNFSISPKSSLLQDLKINRSRYFTSY